MVVNQPRYYVKPPDIETSKRPTIRYSDVNIGFKTVKWARKVKRIAGKGGVTVSLLIFFDKVIAQCMMYTKNTLHLCLNLDKLRMLDSWRVSGEYECLMRNWMIMVGGGCR
nr:hypothetical protein Iba_chr02cCG3620 [Ipomoea batatas]